MKTLETSAGGVIKNGKGEIVIARQNNAFTPWSLPKGHVEPGEDILEAAKREIKEETGISDLVFIKKLPVYQRPMRGRDGVEDEYAIKELHYFVFTTAEEDLRPTDPDNPEAKWIRKEDLIDYLAHPKDKEFFKSVIDEI